jgi:hypothetical protein
MITLVDASAIVDMAGTYDEFIAKLNAQVVYFNEHNHHHARKDLAAGDHAVIEPIDTQTHTGKPITVIPTVHYREEGNPAVELALGKDFSVTYKNNIKVGMAPKSPYTAKAPTRGRRPLPLI